MAKLDDAAVSALLRAGIAGDRSAYRQFFNAISPVVSGMVSALAGAVPSAEREDMIQEILTVIHAKRQTWDMKRPVLPWLYALIRHKTIDLLRQMRRRERGVVAIDIEVLAATVPARLDDPDLSLDLQAALGRLERRMAAVVIAASVEGRDAAEIGAKLGVSANAVRITLHRGLGKMRTLLTANVQGKDTDDRP